MPPDTLRPEQQDDNNGGKSNESGDVCCREAGKNAIHETEDETSQDSPRKASQSAEYDAGDAFHEGEASHSGTDTEKRTDKATRNRRQTAPQKHRKRRNNVDVNALQGCAFAFLGDRKHRLAASAVPDEEEQGHQECKADQKNDKSFPRYCNAEDAEDAGEGAGIRQRLAAGNKKDDALNYKRQAYGNRHWSVGIASEGSEADTFEEDAQPSDEKGGNKNGREEVKAELRDRVVDQIGADHVYLAVGDLHDPHYAEDQRQSQGDQDIYAPQH